jgi:hypothetical protein
LRKALIFILLLFSACVARRQTPVRTYSAPIDSKETIIDSVQKYNLSNSGFYIEKGEISIQRGNKREKFLFTLKFKKPDIFLVSIRNSTGIEGARVFIDNDSIFVNDRINSRLMYGNSGRIEKLTGLPGGSVMTVFGDFLSDGIMHVTNTVISDNKAIVFGVIGAYNFKANIDLSKKKVESYIFRENTGKNSITINYSTFDKGDVPFAKQINFTNGEKELSGIIRIHKLLYPWNGNLEFIPGKGYAKEEIK